MRELLPDEKILNTIHISRLAKWHYYLAGIILILAGVYVSVSGASVKIPNSEYLIIACFGFGIVIFSVSELRRLYHKYIITSKRIIKQSGILKTYVTAWEHETIVNVKFSESLMGRLVKMGTVEVVLVDDNKLPLESVRNPEKIMKIISEIISNK